MLVKFSAVKFTRLDYVNFIRPILEPRGGVTQFSSIVDDTSGIPLQNQGICDIVAKKGILLTRRVAELTIDEIGDETKDTTPSNTGMSIRAGSRIKDAA